jgi:dTDP-glucose 4,6-dehydratase
VCDIKKSDIPIYARAEHMLIDITNKDQVEQIPIATDDIVYNVAARMLHPIVRRRDRHDYFFSVDFEGARDIVDHAMRQGCNRLIQFSTDMVYGRLQSEPPVFTDHPRVPLGEYSDSKRYIEDYCIEKRKDGLVVSIFRPRLIIGPSRLGILANLFRLIRHSLPVPMIGNGSNHYQMVSVFDCASAAVCSADKGVVNGEFNLGSEDPPTVRELLGNLISFAGSRSILIPTPASLVKVILRALDWANVSLMVPEQYEVADLDYVIDITETKRALDWEPGYSDGEMFRTAYDDFVHDRTSATAF